MVYTASTLLADCADCKHTCLRSLQDIVFQDCMLVNKFCPMRVTESVRCAGETRKMVEDIIVLVDTVLGFDLEDCGAPSAQRAVLEVRFSRFRFADAKFKLFSGYKLFYETHTERSVIDLAQGALYRTYVTVWDPEQGVSQPVIVTVPWDESADPILKVRAEVLRRDACVGSYLTRSFCSPFCVTAPA